MLRRQRDKATGLNSVDDPHEERPRRANDTVHDVKTLLAKYERNQRRLQKVLLIVVLLVFVAVSAAIYTVLSAHRSLASFATHQL